MDIHQTRRAPRSDVLQLANHFFFITALAFVAHQNALHDEGRQAQPLFVAQAVSFQPQTPPPAFDPEEMSVEELDMAGGSDLVLAP